MSDDQILVATIPADVFWTPDRMTTGPGVHVLIACTLTNGHLYVIVGVNQPGDERGQSPMITVSVPDHGNLTWRGQTEAMERYGGLLIGSFDPPPVEAAKLQIHVAELSTWAYRREVR